MAGTLGTHSVGSFQVSGAAAGGSTTAVSGSQVSASPTARASGGETTAASAHGVTASDSTAKSSGGTVTTLGGSPSGADDWLGTLGTHQLGSAYLGDEAAGGEATSMALSPKDASPTARSSGGEAESMGASPSDASPTARSQGGSVTALALTPGDAESWHGTLGVAQLGSSYVSGSVAGGETAGASGSAKDATPTSRATAGMDGEELGGFKLGGATVGPPEELVTELGGLPADAAGDTSATAAGSIETLSGSTDADMDRTRQLGEGDLGDGQLGDGGVPLTTTTSGGSVETLDASPAGAIRFIDDWSVEYVIVEKTIEEVRKWDELEVTWRVTQAQLDAAVGALADNAGKVEVIAESDGSFRAIDRADGANTYTIRPPTPRNDVRTVTTWLVDDFQKEPVDQRGADYKVTVKLVPEASK